MSASPALLTFRGETRSLTHWARRIGITRQALVLRLRRARPYVALSMPPGRGRKPTPKQCSSCRQVGHNRQTCAVAAAERAERLRAKAQRAAA